MYPYAVASLVQPMAPVSLASALILQDCRVTYQQLDRRERDVLVLAVNVPQQIVYAARYCPMGTNRPPTHDRWTCGIYSSHLYAHRFHLLRGMRIPLALTAWPINGRTRATRTR